MSDICLHLEIAMWCNTVKSFGWDDDMVIDAFAQAETESLQSFEPLTTVLEKYKTRALSGLLPDGKTKTRPFFCVEVVSPRKEPRK